MVVKMKNEKSTIHEEEPRPRTLDIQVSDNVDRLKQVTDSLISPSLQAALTIGQVPGAFASDEIDLMSLIYSLKDQVVATQKDDISQMEGMLTVQAYTLDALFNSLARRSISNMGEFVEAAEKYMKLALRAQSQCRATIEALSAIKNPPMVGYVKQANIAHGPQQVNNGKQEPDSSRVRKNQNLENELLEHMHGERLDFRTESKTSGDDQTVETMGAVDRSKDSRR